jgi:hypothetical protein
LLAAFAIAPSRRGALRALTSFALVLRLDHAGARARRKKKHKKKKRPGGASPSPPAASPLPAPSPVPPPPPPHAVVECSRRDDPVCESEPNCHCALTGPLADGSTRHCATFDGSTDPCATAPACGVCPPEGYVCDLGAYSYGGCPDGFSRCARNCGGWVDPVCEDFDACQGSTVICGNGGSCFRLHSGVQSRCGKPPIPGTCDCTSDGECVTNHGPGAFCVGITGSACTCGPSGTSFCVVPA